MIIAEIALFAAWYLRRVAKSLHRDIADLDD